jgi:transposase-like protein
MARSTYKPAYAAQARVACRLGAIDKDLQELFGVCEKTLHNWRKKHPEFKEATKEGKDAADDQVQDALFNRAIGCITWKEVYTKEEGIVILQQLNAPDTVACMSWLNNRRPDEWARDPKARQEARKDSSDTYNITIVKPDGADKTD